MVNIPLPPFLLATKVQVVTLPDKSTQTAFCVNLPKSAEYRNDERQINEGIVAFWSFS